MPESTRGQRSLVWTLAVLSTVSYGALYYAQPLLAVAAEHERGWSGTQTGLAFTLALLVTALIAPAVGRALDARGGRVLVGGGAVLGSLAFVLLASTSGYVLFVLGWLLAGVAMALTFYEAVLSLLVVVMTSSASAMEVWQARDTGASAYLSKPVDPAEVLALLSRADAR